MKEWWWWVGGGPGVNTHLSHQGRAVSCPLSTNLSVAETHDTPGGAASLWWETESGGLAGVDDYSGGGFSMLVHQASTRNSITDPLSVFLPSR